MNKNVKRFLLLLLAASLITIFVLIGKISSRLVENPEDYCGNTAGNLYNRGLFVEDENYIYFANVSDYFRLYRMDKNLTEAVRLQSDSVEYLNIDSESQNIYYSRINYRMNTTGNNVLDLKNKGIYRLSLKKNNINCLFSDTCGSVTLAGNELLFQVHGSDGDYDLYSLKTSVKNSKQVLLSNLCMNPVNYYQSSVYYAGVENDHYLYAYQPSTEATFTAAEIDCYLPISGRDGVYFLSLAHDYALYLLPHTSDEATKIIDELICTYNLSADENVLFYQTDKKKENQLVRYDIYSKDHTVIMEGDFKNLNTIGNYLFFTDFQESTWYVYNIKTEEVTPLSPEIKK